MNDDFTVHLVSNVSPETFPENSPAKFSTLLANEINLGAGNWEVGVRQIMYPTHVATTSKDENINVFKYKDEYRDLLPSPERGNYTDYKHVVFDLKGVKTAKDKLKFLLDTVNGSTWAKKDIFSLEYKKEKKKFVFHIKKEDIVVVMPVGIGRYMGFNQLLYRGQGTFWAWSTFDVNAQFKHPVLTWLLCDLQTLEKETFQLLRTYEQGTGHIYYAATKSNEFKDSVPDIWFPTPKFSISVDPFNGLIKKRQIVPFDPRVVKHQKNILFYDFDKNATNALKLQSIYSELEHQDISFPKLSKKKKDELLH